MTPDEDATLCWIWWESTNHNGHHRCAQRDGHMGLHECCCGARAVFGHRAVAHVHPRLAPCNGTCPAHAAGKAALLEQDAAGCE